MSYQRPAYEEVVIAHGGSTLTLRPSLRAAATLESKFGFPALSRALDEGNLTIIKEVILSCSSTRQDAAAFHFSQTGRPLSQFFASVQAPLHELLSMFFPASDPKSKPAPSAGKPMPWGDYYAALYEQATGWLGWTPEAAWNATPTEIDRAYAANIAKLKAIHGSNDKEEKPAVAPDPDAAFDRNALESLRGSIVRNGR
jgi:hypothetical protein